MTGQFGFQSRKHLLLIFRLQWPSNRLQLPGGICLEKVEMLRLSKFFATMLLIFWVMSATAAVDRRVVIYEGVVTELAANAPFPQSADLWVTLPDLKRTTGFVVKPQGVCREELCVPLPKQKRNDYLTKRGAVTWFNLSAFARLMNQPFAHDAQLATWYFGPREEKQNRYVGSLEAPNFTLPDMNGTMHSLADFRGKKVLLMTWASW